MFKFALLALPLVLVSCMKADPGIEEEYQTTITNNPVVIPAEEKAPNAYAQPDFNQFLIKVEDQRGCKWWRMQSGSKFTHEYFWVVLKNGKPECPTGVTPPAFDARVN